MKLAAEILIALSFLYPKTAVVTELDYVTDIVTVEDCNGFEWEFEGCEDYMIDDVVGLIMYDNGTKEIFDDQIVEARYNGACWNSPTFKFR